MQSILNTFENPIGKDLFSNLPSLFFMLTVSNPLNILELKTCDPETQYQQNPIIYMNKSRNELIDICKDR